MIGDLTYEYDKAGNRTKIGGSFARTGIPQNMISANYNGANQQVSFGDKTLTYDDNGNLTSITDASGTTLYSWNARNQLVGISGPNVNASFLYDGAGRRQRKTIGLNTTEFLYDGVNPVQETSGATVLANILSGLGIDEFFTRTDVAAGTTSHILPDALGSALALANSAAAVQTEYTYDPFGSTTVTGASNTNAFQYTGRENDGTGLYYYRARYNHPQLQRFISEDPIEFRSGSFNIYAYLDNNPINSKDPLGLYVGGIGGFGSLAGGSPGVQGAVMGAGFAGFVHDSNGNWGFAVCGAFGPATGAGLFLGGGSINSWGAGTICDLEGAGGGFGYGGGGRAGGGVGLGAFVEVAANLRSVASGLGAGWGGFAGYGGFGGCVVFPMNTSCNKCPR